MNPNYQATDHPCLLTGATGAIGKEIANHLAANGESIILACRNTNKAEELKNELLQKYPQCRKIWVVCLDLSDEESVINAAKTIKDALIRQISHPETKEYLYYTTSLKAIINNAGVMNRHFSVDSKGREKTMSVNYCNTRLLCELLKDNVYEGGVIVFTTSLTRFLHKRTDYPTIFAEKDFSQLGTYGRSKRMITEYARTLEKEMQLRNIRVNCADPGIVNSDMIRMERWYDRLADIFFRPFIRTPRQGAKPALRALSTKQTGRIFCKYLTHRMIML